MHADIKKNVLTDENFYKYLKIIIKEEFMFVKNSNKVKTKLYLDSNIFLNVWFVEMVKFGEVFYSSIKLLDEIINCRYHLVVSELTIKELSKKTELPADIIYDEFLKVYEIIDKLTIVKVTKKIAEDAVYFSSSHGIHKPDALHAMMAKSNDCLLITRDIELRYAASKYGIPTFRPEEII